MKDFSKSKNYEDAKTFTGTGIERLPVGGYVLQIYDATIETYDWGEKLALEFDIVEGEHVLYFTENYAAQPPENKKWKGMIRLTVPKDDGSEKDAITMRIFKTAIYDLEASNPNYHWNWDEKTLKGKLVGGLFGNKEWAFNGKTGFFTECAYLTSVNAIREGKLKIPKDKLLKTSTPLNNFKNKLDVSTTDDDDELPFM